MEKEILKIKNELLTQNNRSTSFPIFIIVEDKKVYGIDPNFTDYRERIEDYDEDDLCENCCKLEPSEMPDDCDDCMADCFISYRIDKNVPNLYGGFFFTAKACEEHLQLNRHHYNKSANSYAISATHNYELKTVMEYLKK